jgi:hypothetical protein
MQHRIICRSVSRHCQLNFRVETPLGEEFLDVSIAQCEAKIEPHRMLDDRWRKAMAAIGDISHRASLSSASLPGYLVILNCLLHCRDGTRVLRPFKPADR